MSDTSLTRAGSESALNTEARRSAAAVSSTPPVKGEQQAVISSLVSDAVASAMEAIIAHALTSVDVSSTIDPSKLIDKKE